MDYEHEQVFWNGKYKYNMSDKREGIFNFPKK
jgi:hypothetical protein